MTRQVRGIAATASSEVHRLERYGPLPVHTYIKHWTGYHTQRLHCALGRLSEADGSIQQSIFGTATSRGYLKTRRSSACVLPDTAVVEPTSLIARLTHLRPRLHDQATQKRPTNRPQPSAALPHAQVPGELAEPPAVHLAMPCDAIRRISKRFSTPPTHTALALAAFRVHPRDRILQRSATYQLNDCSFAL
jgi:hypothetical protein